MRPARHRGNTWESLSVVGCLFSIESRQSELRIVCHSNRLSGEREGSSSCAWKCGKSRKIGRRKVTDRESMNGGKRERFSFGSCIDPLFLRTSTALILGGNFSLENSTDRGFSRRSIEIFIKRECSSPSWLPRIIRRNCRVFDTALFTRQAG